MPCATEVVHGEGGTIKVGTTGTIGSLMTRELDTIKVAPQAAAGTPRLRHQGRPVSVLCGATTPRKLMLRKSSSDISSSSSSNNRTDRVSAEEACKPRRVSRRNTFDSPMLRSDSALMDRTPNAGKAKKKGSVYGVEVVDIKCGNPMSSRLRKLGFSKLSETFA
ncbi:hypothetical protein BDA96_02G336500 [Sorghum bicolor]|uniref:Uncharacterized protein n=2 Tax=Sorghum bicolor TaxID=4558 RepID=A0A921RS84_SORBI|nr:uncharacterized protein LOC8084052 [Sorghum bicolor]KAG0545146.1 hypothetical protein BDA96_02G336500 [Sorghum bicolor]OQU90023.1 hypothetical protein SORBI_3002G320800 [Sorghum bicolor]|eukprot:XP_002460788.1 uncharacterized protein LOC8084052 [Sorghum bicolor]